MEATAAARTRAGSSSSMAWPSMRSTSTTASRASVAARERASMLASRREISLVMCHSAAAEAAATATTSTATTAANQVSWRFQRATALTERSVPFPDAKDSTGTAWAPAIASAICMAYCGSAGGTKVSCLPVSDCRKATSSSLSSPERFAGFTSGDTLLRSSPPRT